MKGDEGHEDPAWTKIKHCTCARVLEMRSRGGWTEAKTRRSPSSHVQRCCDEILLSKFEEESKVKLLASIAFAVGLGMASAQAMPAAPLHDTTGAVTQVGWRCGPGWHINGWGRCVPSRRHYRAWGYYGPPRFRHRHWHHHHHHRHHRHWRRW
jgi:hypothetical protein